MGINTIFCVKNKEKDVNLNSWIMSINSVNVATKNIKDAKGGVPSRTRTCNLLLRRQLLYPIEPWALVCRTL